MNWKDYTQPYLEALEQVKQRMEKSNQKLMRQVGYSPIESVKTRVKSEASARAKLERKKIKFDEKGLKVLQDIGGMRIICKFVDDIPEIVGLIRSWQNVKIEMGVGTITCDQVHILEELDYVSNPKPSGYRSYHVICSRNGIVFEIQIRTLAMDFWSSCEHMLEYKYGGKIPPDISEKLRSMADIAYTLDMGMNGIRQDVNVGTAKARIMDRIYEALALLDENKSIKAEQYRAQIERHKDDLDELRRISVELDESTLHQYRKIS